ncbi:MAG: translation initiation factor [Mariniblastus sp.]|nr:translation initiation factor [Mariniblastus sp.]
MRLFEGTPFDRPPKCDQCDQLTEQCECLPTTGAEVPPEKQTLRIGVEKRKKGKVVTVIRDLAQDNQHAKLLTALKSSCGAGGNLSNPTTIEIQGDHAERIQSLLIDRGFKIRKR